MLQDATNKYESINATKGNLSADDEYWLKKTNSHRYFGHPD